MSMTICLREVIQHGVFNECITISINTHHTFFDGIEALGLSLIEDFGNLYRTTNVNSGDIGFLQYAEIGYDDILDILTYLTTDECREDLTNNENDIDSLYHEFNCMKLYVERRDCEYFSVYIL